MKKLQSEVQPAQNGNEEKSGIVAVTYKIPVFENTYTDVYKVLNDANIESELKKAYDEANRCEEGDWIELSYYYDGVIVCISSYGQRVFVSCDGGLCGEVVVSDVEGLIRETKSYAAAVRNRNDKYEIITVEEI